MHTIDIRQAAESDFPPVIRRVALKLLDHSYMAVGNFLCGLSPSDLKEIAGYCTEVALGINTDIVFDSLLLLSEMLAQAEGEQLEIQDMSERASNLMILISFESLHRRDLVVFDHGKATLSGDITKINGLVTLK